MRILFSFLIIAASCSFAQTLNFQAAYNQHPSIPKGILESVSWSRTHMKNIDASTTPSCSGMPLPYGVMGMFDNGANYFVENGSLVAQLSGISVEAQKESIDLQIEAYASAFEQLFHMDENTKVTLGERIYNVLFDLSEIPNAGLTNLYAKESQIYEVLINLEDASFASEHSFSPFSFDKAAIFGADNYRVLSSGKVMIENGVPTNVEGRTFGANSLKSTEYGPAIWNPAATCNYSSRSGTPISAITIHTIQGTYAGAIGWAQNCASSVSYHYVVRSSDGQITQMVLEADKAWHVGSENPYTIGYEHDGYVNDPSWYTEALYNASADLSRDIVNSGYGIPPLRTYFGPSSSGNPTLGSCTKIKGHQHYPNQTHTDPGINWNWEKYYKLINNAPTYTSVTSPDGTLTDSGGSAGSYNDDERLLWLIQPDNVVSITLDFTAFNLELNYDYLFIYDGSTPDAPLIGKYTGTNSPGTVNSTGQTLLLEFRSDCATIAPGWEATYTSVPSDVTPPVSVINATGTWQTTDFNVTFTDTDDTGVEEAYYLPTYQNSSETTWKAAGDLGYAHEDFNENKTNWTDISGTFTLNAGVLYFGDGINANSNSSMSVTQDASNVYLYEWNQKITSANANQRAGIHFFCSDASLANRGDSYFVYLRQGQNKAQIYSVDADTYTLQTNDTCVIDANVNYNVKVLYNPSNGWIKVFVDNVLVSSWQDPTPLTSGNAISLRSGGCTVDFDNIKVYHQRGTSITTTVGPMAELREQSLGGSESGQILTKLNDANNNWSTDYTKLVKVDWTAPELDHVNDGFSADVDTTYSTTLNMNWQTLDPHSNITSYRLAIGTTPGTDDVKAWTNVGTSTVYAYILSSPIIDQIYYVSIEATNGAGLIETYTSDGQRYVVNTAGLEGMELSHLVVYPNPTSDFIKIEGLNGEMNARLFDVNGKEVAYKVLSSTNNTISCLDLADGTYNLVIGNGSAIIVKKIIVSKGN